MPTSDGSAPARDRTLFSLLARWSAILAVTVLVYGLIILAFTWCNAALTDRLPTQSDIAYYERTANGPWDHVRDLNILVNHAMMAPMFAAGFALLALLFRPMPRTAALFAVSLVTFFVLLFTHFWLID
ncbi:MAG TPA: hypothetical protein VML55_26540 [Planctomycetaceae bacterium]|nr:hypothetical protein [Planctomycetaceae bacterium]